MKLSFDLINQLEDVVFLLHPTEKNIVYMNPAAKEFVALLRHYSMWPMQPPQGEVQDPLKTLSSALSVLPLGLSDIELNNLNFSVHQSKVDIENQDYLLYLFKEDLATSSELTSLIKAFYNSIVITTGECVIEKSLTDPSVSPTNPIGLNLKELEESGHVMDSISLKIAKTKGPIKTHVKYPSGKVLSWTGKPFYNASGKMEHIVSVGKDITKIVDLNARLQKERQLEKTYKEQIKSLKEAFHSKGIIYSSESMKNIIDTIMKIASTDSPVILTGESGVGKDLMATIIHEAGNRKSGPFIPINCSAIPEALMESELFGYEKGAFTGADPKGKIGYFEAANGGTLFLDEIGELPLPLQSKLLRVLQEKIIYRIGSNKPIPIDVRVLSATNITRDHMYDWKDFRQDLYYRLSVIDIEIPPLRNRKEDIFPLADHFLGEYNRKYQKNLSFSHDAIRRMYHHPWRGNVRELKNTIEIEVLLADGDKINMNSILGGDSSYANHSDDQAVIVHHLTSMKEAYQQVENILIKKAIDETGSITGAAKKLNIAPSTIHRKLNNGSLQL